MKKIKYDRELILKNPLQYIGCIISRYNKDYILLDINQYNNDIMLIDVNKGGFCIIDDKEKIIVSGLFISDAYNSDSIFYFKNKIYQKQFN